jgi:UDPglucose--hexose-1-phosphate uridylyltransferase
MNEFRQEISSGDWVILAPGRAARPHFLDEKKPKREPSPKDTCPFEDLEKSGNHPAILSYPEKGAWRIALIPNKYPALEHAAGCAVSFVQGIYHGKTGVGKHELVITRDHNRNFAELDKAEAFEVLKMIQNRYRTAAEDPCGIYAAAFFNWGAMAGASLWHPHYQILILPIIPPHVMHSLRGSEAYFKKHHRCVRCDIIREEKKEKKRVVEENEHAIAITPYASKTPFEVRILPKKHFPHFWKTPPAVTRSVALLLQSVMRRVKQHANDPDLNFFIHEAPFGRTQYEHHHWHIEVVPKISTFAGFELSTGIEINVVDPDFAAAVLRGEKKK